MDNERIPPSDISEIKEEQLSITFDDLAEKSGGQGKVMSTKEFLEVKDALKKQSAQAAEKGHSNAAQGAKATERSVGENVPEKLAELQKASGIVQVSRESEKPAEPQKISGTVQAPRKPEEDARPAKAPLEPEPPPEPLSDMEVMEHTASVWQYKEITDDGTEKHSEFHEKHIQTPCADIIGARVRGKKHKHEGTNCDDYFETACTDDCAIAVVCDGAGSKPLSRIGSRVSSEAAAKYLKENLEGLFKARPDVKKGLCEKLNSPEFMAACGMIAPLVQQSAREAFAAQQKELEKLQKDEKYEKALGRNPLLSDLYTTFLAAVAVPLEINGEKECFMACVQIGDGCVCALDSTADSEHCLKMMGEADSGAFSGETDFLSEKNSKPDAISAKTRISRGRSDCILLMSDGVADDYFPAAPMMKRLYLDLCLNGILPMAGKLTGSEDPAPIRFRSVSMSQTSVALQYAKQLLSEKSDAAMNALWDKREMLRCHSLEAFRTDIGDTPEERLRVWLDNYNERGSFDDRTLVIVKIYNGQ